MTARILIVAGSDPSGGAGIQADIKTVTALGGYAATAITALTVQNTLGVTGVVGVEPDIIQQQMRAVIDDIGIDVIKTGMLHNAEVIDAVSDIIDELDPSTPIVVDPVMVSQSGSSLLDPNSVQTLTRRLSLRATVMTPNIPEAEKLTGMTIRDIDGMLQAAAMLHTIGPKAVLLKGGHMQGGSSVTDILASEEGIETFESPRIDTPHVHGTGCTLASAIATGLGQGMAVRDAVVRARAYLQEAIRTNPGLGGGQGPLNHGHTVNSFDAP